jgi:hypothetical protein
MVSVVLSLLFSVICCVLMVRFWFHQKAQERRIATQKDFPRERLVPRHYKSFTEVEYKLWAAAREQERAGVWDNVRFRPQQPEFQIVREYVRGLREDFRRAFNIYGQVIIRCPEMKIFAMIEWQRVKIEFAYCRWCALAWLRLRTVGISIQDLRQLTEIVATLAYHARKMLTALESSGNTEFVDSILRQS